MLSISQRTSEMLEWPAFLQFFTQFVTSPAAKQLLHTVRPVEKLEEEFELSRDALVCAQKEIAPSLGSLEDIAPILRKTTIQGNILPGSELYLVYRLAALNNDVRNRINGWKNELPALHTRFSHLPDLRNIEQEIDLKIEPNGEVKEDATPELTRIRKHLGHLNAKVQHSLERFLRDSRYKSALQEDYVTTRHSRSVLVVRSEMQNAIRGVIHGESGSTASVFVEPFAVVELNNEIAQLTDRQQQEINRILRDLTTDVGRETDALLFALQELSALDLVLARGRFGQAYRCVIPEISAVSRLALIESRHPLLESRLAEENKTIVPFTVELSAGQKALVVTGPNTGGKTVFLKTCGLLSLMAHCALPVPAAEGTILPALTAIEADIGDQQSIQESLSTFSSHMTNIIRILENLKPNSLVLLDELGTGTDPEEGAALAVSILQELLEHKIMVLITSHHSQMKMFAFNHPECVTAAMEFDQQKLLPTFKILVDQIGASHGFDMAERLGLPESVLARARSSAGRHTIQLEEFQSRLQERIRSVEEMQAALERERSDWARRSAADQQQLRDRQQKLEQKLSKLREENTDLIRTLNAKVENMLARIKDAELRQELKKTLKEEVLPAMDRLQESTAVAAPEPALDIQPGDRVWVRLYKDTGEVVAVKKGNAEIILRNKRFQVPVSMLEKRESVTANLPKGVHVQIEEKNIERELNLIGKTVEEALLLTDKYLDDAFLAQLPEVRLIHGHGTGRLKKALQDWLPQHPHVLRFHPESAQQGGTGVTVVEIKR